MTAGQRRRGPRGAGARRRLAALSIAALLGSVGGSIPEVRAAQPRTATSGATEAADRVRVVVAPIAFDGPIRPTARADLAARLREGIAAAGFDPVDPAARSSTAPGHAACRAAACRRTLVTSSSATHVVVGTVALDGRDYTIVLDLYAADGEEVVARVDERCELCGIAEALDVMSTLGAALRRQLEVAALHAPILDVASEPPGASVVVDGRTLGVTPLRLPTEPGHHEVALEKTGYATARYRLELVRGATETISTKLRSEAAGVAEVAPRRPIRVALGWTAVATGGAGLVAGATLLAIDGRPIRRKCTGANVDADGTCRFQHDTLVPGAVIGAIGLALLATGITLVVVERRRAKKAVTARRAAVVPTPLGVAGRF